MRLFILVLLLTSFLSACSGGGGGSSSSTTTNAATGPMAVAKPSCGGSTCISSSTSSSLTTFSTNSKDNLLSYAGDIYNNFYGTIIPKINQTIYGLEAAAKENGLNSCSDIAAASISNSVNLGSSYSVDIAAGSKTIPTHLTGAGTTMSRKFTIYYNSAAFAEVQIFCNSTTQTTTYVRATQAGKTFEFWSQKNSASNAIAIYGAFDEGTKKYSLFFKTNDGNAFEMHVVGLNFPIDNSTVDFAMAGGVNLSSNIADIGVVVGSSNTTPASLSSADANDAAWSGTNIRHCYSSLTTAAVTTTAATCNGLLTLTPANGAIRQSVTAWTTNGINQSIPGTY